MSKLLMTAIAGLKVPTFLKATYGMTAVLENHIANNVISAGLKSEPSVRTTAECPRVHFIGSSMYSKFLTSYITRTPTIKLFR